MGTFTAYFLDGHLQGERRIIHEPLRYLSTVKPDRAPLQLYDPDAKFDTAATFTRITYHLQPPVSGSTCYYKTTEPPVDERAIFRFMDALRGELRRRGSDVV